MTNTERRMGLFGAALLLTLGSGVASAQDPGTTGMHDMKGMKHGAQGHDAKAAEAAPEGTTVDLWVCESDPTTGLSWEAACPLDGKPAVKKTVERSTLTDLKNGKCPIMGGDVDHKSFAVYKGKIVHFCCPGCAGKFFADAATHIAAIEKAAGASTGDHPDGHAR